MRTAARAAAFGDSAESALFSVTGTARPLAGGAIREHGLKRPLHGELRTPISARSGGGYRSAPTSAATTAMVLRYSRPSTHSSFVARPPARGPIPMTWAPQ